MKRQAAKLVSVSEIPQEPTEQGMQDTSLEDIGARLALTLRALILTRFQMARLLGTDMPTWGTYEAGLARIPVEQALKLSSYGSMDLPGNCNRPAPARTRNDSGIAARAGEAMSARARSRLRAPKEQRRLFARIFTSWNLEDARAFLSRPARRKLWANSLLF